MEKNSGEGRKAEAEAEADAESLGIYAQAQKARSPSLLPILSQSRTMRTREENGLARGHMASWQNQSKRKFHEAQ